MPLRPRIVAVACALLATSGARPAQGVAGGDAAAALERLSLEELLRLRVPSLARAHAGPVLGASAWSLAVDARRERRAGLREGTDDRSTGAVLAVFSAVPHRMTEDRVRLTLTRALGDRLALRARLPFFHKQMDHRTAAGGAYRTVSTGPGDLELALAATLWESRAAALVLDAGLSVPTGSIDAEDDTPQGADHPLPYPMQLGSGTVDLRPELAWRVDGERWGAGARASAVVRLGRNANAYALGDRLALEGWLARGWTRRCATTLRLVAHKTGNVDGDDPDLDPAFEPTARPDVQGGERVDLTLELRLLGGRSAQHHFDLALGTPLHESLNGPQLRTRGWGSLTYTLALHR